MIEMDDKDIRRVMHALGKELNSSKAGKAIKRDVSKRLRKLMQPMVNKRKAAVLRLPSQGHVGASMRTAIAKQVRAKTRWTGDSGGVSISQSARGMPRGFPMAGRAFNRPQGWNPKSLGGEVEHQMVRPVAWFDSQQEAGDKERARHEIVEALEDAAGTLASKIRSI